MPAKTAKTTAKKTVKKVVVKKVKVEIKTVAKTPKVSSTVHSSFAVDMYNLSGKTAGKIELPKEIFGAKINDTLMAQAVRVYLANQRQGNASTKSRGEVKGSSKKIYRQKGTGNARHGSKRAPIFVHGGVAMGPNPHDFSLKLPRKMKKAALLSALSTKLKDGEIKVISGFEKIEPKTKIMHNALKTISKDYKNVLLVSYKSPKNELTNLYKASRNIKTLKVVNADLLNTFEVLKSNEILLMKESIDVMKDSFMGKGQKDEQ